MGVGVGVGVGVKDMHRVEDLARQAALRAVIHAWYMVDGKLRFKHEQANANAKLSRPGPGFNPPRITVHGDTQVEIVV